MGLQRDKYEELRAQAEECENCGDLVLEDLWYDEYTDMAVCSKCLSV